ncbi:MULTISPECIES: proline dehydrogenase family protein [unclassified Paenibacillus]|uniref:proline dehydrogenase family protein n=1 Tax=unclassified Paenibacillus TaxID=185978 RepID=UPI002F3F73EF
MKELEWAALASNMLKRIARREDIRAYVEQSKELYPILFRAAQRFIAGESKETAVAEAEELISKGYAVSLEYIGENTRTMQECELAKAEFIHLIRSAGAAGIQTTISLDLSHIGLEVDSEFAYGQLIELAKEAAQYRMNIMISAEESAKTDRILQLYRRSSEACSNIGITLQAHLHRTLQDFNEIAECTGPVRIVKGAFKEPEQMALPRSEELNNRYLHLTETILSAGRSLSIATHDESIIEEVQKRGYLDRSNVQMEMLYGIRPEKLKQLKKVGYKTQVYVPYGREWHLYFCHRLAEYPPNIYKAIADMAELQKAKESDY